LPHQNPSFGEEATIPQPDGRVLPREHQTFRQRRRIVADSRNPWFSRLAKWASRTTGTTWAFMVAALLIAAWLVTGPVFRFSDTWQLVINTTTTIVTFLMVFLIQNTQNRDSEAMHLKLNEIIRALEGAHVGLLDLEELTVEELDRVKRRYCLLAERARADLKQGLKDTGTPETEDEPEPRYDHKGRVRGAKRQPPETLPPGVSQTEASR
jgi:low affinity Fe/Cu permease